jgi:hypothetical protein
MLLATRERGDWMREWQNYPAGADGRTPRLFRTVALLCRLSLLVTEQLH